MKFEVDKRKDKTIFKLIEKTLGHQIAAELKTELIFLQKEIDNPFTIDLSEVTRCDSTGLSCLLLSERMEREKERKLTLKNVNKSLLDLMKIARLDKVFVIK
ncbi:MAG TPA: STAS domain-containing protein [Ignavibacteria bacterium]